MHPCLLIPELALYIIHFLADDRPAWHDSRYLKNSRDVARLARTCKVLAEPALDVLWRTQHSLSPLVMCLPSDVWELTKRKKTIVSYDHCPRPTPRTDACAPSFESILLDFQERHHPCRLGPCQEVFPSRPVHLPACVICPQTRRCSPGQPHHALEFRSAVSLSPNP